MDQTEEEVVRRLDAARKRYEEAARALRGKHRRGGLKALKSASDECVAIERELARVRGEEVAVPIDWSHRWDAGAPSPHVVSSGHRTLLIYLLSEPDPEWDGTYVSVIDPSSEQQHPLALVEFKPCYAYTFGGPNNEVFRGHRLSGRGLSGYGAYYVENSRWIEEYMRINSVHAQYSADRWSSYRHYLLTFHDETLECVAEDYSVEVLHTSFQEAIRDASTRLLE